MEFRSLQSSDIFIFVLAYFASRRLLRLLENRETAHQRRRPPSFPALPLVGSLPFLGSGGDQLYRYFLSKTGQLGNVFTFYAGKRLALVLNGREAIVDALVNHGEDFADRSPLWTEENCLNKKLRGITFKHYGESLRKYRMLTSSVLCQMSSGERSTIELRIQQGLEVLKEQFRKQDGTSFDPKDFLAEFSGRIILSILFGARFVRSESPRVREILESSSKYLANIDPLFDVLPVVRFLPVFRRKIVAMVEAKETLLRSLEEELCSSLQVVDSEESFVGRFTEIEPRSHPYTIETGSPSDRINSSSDENHPELIHVLRDIIFGGAVTVSTSLLWALVLLADNPLVQDRLREEIDEVVPADRLPSIKDKDRLPYAEAVLLEVLRRKGVAPFSSTRATVRETEVCGFHVPAGCMVLVNLYSAHMDPKDWTDPEDFRPERFLDPNNKIILKDRIIPFCLGLRACIGDNLALHEIFLSLCSLVQQFTIKPPEGQETVATQETYSIVMAPTPFKIRFIPRKL